MILRVEWIRRGPSIRLSCTGFTRATERRRMRTPPVCIVRTRKPSASAGWWLREMQCVFSIRPAPRANRCRANNRSCLARLERRESHDPTSSHRGRHVSERRSPLHRHRGFDCGRQDRVRARRARLSRRHLLRGSAALFRWPVHRTPDSALQAAVQTPDRPEAGPRIGVAGRTRSRRGDPEPLYARPSAPYVRGSGPAEDAFLEVLVLLPVGLRALDAGVGWRGGITRKEPSACRFRRSRDSPGFCPLAQTSTCLADTAPAARLASAQNPLGVLAALAGLYSRRAVSSVSGNQAPFSDAVYGR